MKTMLEWGTAVNVRTTCMASVLGVFVRLSPAILLSLIVAASSSESAAADSPTAPAMTYPPTRTVDVVDDYFGTKVADPYRWLEDLDSPTPPPGSRPRTRSHSAYLDKSPQREEIRQRLTELWDYQKTGLPVLEAGQLWFAQNSGLQRQSPVYRQAGFQCARRWSSTPISVTRWFGRPGPVVTVARRPMARLHECGRRLRRRGHPCQGSCDRQRPHERRAAHEVLQHRLDEGQPGILLLALQGHRDLGRLREPPTRSTSCGTTRLGGAHAGSPDLRAARTTADDFVFGGVERRRTLALLYWRERHDQ